VAPLIAGPSLDRVQRWRRLAWTVAEMRRCSRFISPPRANSVVDPDTDAAAATEAAFSTRTSLRRGVLAEPAAQTGHAGTAVRDHEPHDRSASLVDERGRVASLVDVSADDRASSLPVREGSARARCGTRLCWWSWQRPSEVTCAGPPIPGGAHARTACSVGAQRSPLFTRQPRLEQGQPSCSRYACVRCAKRRRSSASAFRSRVRSRSRWISSGGIHDSGSSYPLSESRGPQNPPG
jgi:hypothetical protein